MTKPDPYVANLRQLADLCAADPGLVNLLTRLADLEATAKLSPAEMHEMNELRKAFDTGWLEVSSAATRATILGEDAATALGISLGQARPPAAARR